MDLSGASRTDIYHNWKNILRHPCYFLVNNSINLVFVGPKTYAGWLYPFLKVQTRPVLLVSSRIKMTS